ncbi:DUF1801 domain-containing protein [Luteococcus peritonei]|uniref:Iron chaperone n=1 Tax=Luteococcus peritonei TaxID=88874 RepID=A0ABW4RXI9_9ACTN
MTVVDDHLTGLAEPERAALQHLRELVHAEVPGVLEVESYRLPAFAVDQRKGNRIVGGFAAGRRFLSWYTFSGHTLERFADRLAGFETTKSAIHFSPQKMIPDELLLALVRDRLETIRAQG